MNADFLLKSLAATPEAEPVDAIKWLYQSEFGCGHLLADEVDCAQRIEQERSQPQSTAPQAPYTPLGNGLCRLNLAHPLVCQLPTSRIARMMRVTQATVQGSKQRFDESVALLGWLAAQQSEATQAAAGTQRLPFTAGALELYLHTHADDLTSPPSHSQRYRQAYTPAYRVVLCGFGQALPALAAMEKQLAAEQRVTLALDGDCAAGKTTLATLLAKLYDCNVIHMDDFFLPFDLRTRERMAQAGGNVHYERVLAQVLTPLVAGIPFCYDAFDCHTGLSRTCAVTPKAVTVIEGSYALHPAFDDAYAALHAVRALLYVHAHEQQRRILARNGEAMLKRFKNEWIPLEKQYLQAYHKQRADELILLSHAFHEDNTPKGAVSP